MESTAWQSTPRGLRNYPAGPQSGGCSLTGARVERRLAAIMAPDIVGYSRLIDADEAATLSSIKTLRADVVDPILTEHKGRIVKLMGDGALVEFDSVVDAVACAIAMQKGVAAHQAGSPPDRRIVFRIGIVMVVVEGDDLFGHGMNVPARLEQRSPPGDVLIVWAGSRRQPWSWIR